MTGLPPTAHELRVLVLAPTAMDARLVAGLFARSHIGCEHCRDLDDVLARLPSGAGALLLPEEALSRDEDHRLASWLRRQPTWSDLPVLVLVRKGETSELVQEAIDRLGNAVVLERPTRIAALVSAVRTALRARARQYQIRNHLIERERSEARLRDADRRKNEFLAILAHELRNPLAPIRNSLHILRLNSMSDPLAASVSEMMERQVNHMVRLVDDLMEVSRITRDRIELRRERIDLARVVNNALETSQPMIEAGGHRLVLEEAGEPLLVLADPVRLAQTFANLLNNAAKYTPPGGTIGLAVRREGDRAVVTVRDNGIGIAPEMLPRVFELFTQADTSDDAMRSGLGIGLTLARRLAEMHDATLEAASKGLGEGSEFTVRMPLAAPDPAKDVPRNGGDALPLSKHRVLIVDDHPDAASSLGILLRLLGQDVRIENSGRAAIDALPEFLPSVVLLDISMPELDGYDVARLVRADPRWADLPLIALSGRGQEEDRRLSTEAGFDLYMVKPADIDVLSSVLRALEGGRAAFESSVSARPDR